ncbi:MAG: hypothetical protein WC155_00545 [Candidatus Cloacimonadales bacterium]
MIGEKKLKFKFNPTPTLAKLYEQQGLYQDALVIYRYLQSLGKNDFSDKVRELTEKLSSDTSTKSEEVSLSEDVINKQTIDVSVDSHKASPNRDRVYDEVGSEKTVILPEYDSLINTLFNDEEKTYFKIVPSEEFFYNKNQELISIFTQNEIRHSNDVVEDEVMDNQEKDFQELIEIREDISPEVTVEDFVNILYTYYTKDTKISEIKIGDLFLLLSTIKLENC